MNEEFIKLFFRESPIKVLLCCRQETFSSKIAKDIDGTYSHVVNVCKDFMLMGLICSTKRGRRVFYTTTEKGRVLIKNIDNILNL